MQHAPYTSPHRLDPRSFAMALAVKQGHVWWAPGVVAIPLQRKNDRNGEVVLISAEDAHLSRFYWSHSRWGYPRRRDKSGKAVMLHREILGLSPGDGSKLVVDHINRDRFDCRRENLRLVTQAENMQNVGPRRGGTSSHRGVSFHKRSRKWVVMHTLNRENRYGGRFDTEEEAIAVARAWRAEHMPYSGETSPHRGVSWDKRAGKWLAQAKKNYKNVCIGRFETEEEAAEAAAAWRREHMPLATD